MPPEFSEAGLVEPGPVEPGPVERQLRQKIETTFAPEECSIDNDSPAHQGQQARTQRRELARLAKFCRTLSPGTKPSLHRCLAEDMKSILAYTLDLKTPQERDSKRMPDAQEIFSRHTLPAAIVERQTPTPSSASMHQISLAARDICVVVQDESTSPPFSRTESLTMNPCQTRHRKRLASTEKAIR